jgi:hypothetical protein
MSIAFKNIQVKGLARQKWVKIQRRASQLGMTTEGYLKHLVDEDLAISHRAKTTTFSELMPTARKANEAELDRLVESARTQYHRRASRRR